VDKERLKKNILRKLRFQLKKEGWTDSEIEAFADKASSRMAKALPERASSDFWDGVFMGIIISLGIAALFTYFDIARKQRRRRQVMAIRW